MNTFNMSSEIVTNLSSITDDAFAKTDDVFTKVINVTDELVGDLLNHSVSTHINVTHDVAKKLTYVTEEGVSRLLRAADDVGICDFIISNVTSGNVTTTVTTYNPAACGVYGSYPFLKPLLIFILVCFILWAIFGNSCLVGVITTDKNMQEPGNIFLCAMAFNDVAQSFTHVPIAIHSLVHGESPGGHWCRCQTFFITFLATLSIYLQTSLWICRYIHIAHPFTYQTVLTRARLAVAMSFCFLTALAPPLVGLARAGTVSTWAVDMVSVDIAEPASLILPCTNGGPESVVMAALCFIGVITSCCFAILIYRVARRSQKKHDRKRTWRAQADKLEKKLKAAKTLGIVVGVQWVTWMPGLVLGVVGQLFGGITVATAAFYGDIFYLFLQTSTFSDSIVYAFRNRIYRRALAQLYRKMRNAFGNI